MTGAAVLLALETSGPVGSVAVSVAGEVRGRRFLGEAGGHAAALIPAVADVLGDAETGRDSLTGVVVGAGPGSFTGVRVAAAAAKGLAFALDIPLWPVSSLLGAALTEQALPGEAGPWGPAGEVVGQHLHTRYLLFDARGDRVFAGAYRLTQGLPRELRPPFFAHLPEILEDEALAGAGFCGDGAVRHADLLESRGRLVLKPPLGFPSADGLLRVMALDPDRPPVEDAGEWEPDYLRESAAERARDG